MITPVKAAALIGFSGTIIDIECDITQGLPNVTVVGLPTKAVDEAKERVRSAIRNSGLTMPRARVTLNLAPAGLKKEGTGFDLPLAVAILQASGQLEVGTLGRSLFVGELSLKGNVRPIPGILNYVEAAAHAGIEQVFVPAKNALQASLVPEVLIYGIENLQQLQQHLTGVNVLSTTKSSSLRDRPSDSNLYGHIVGQDHAKRALQIAAAGHHNLLMSGPPGGGKTMLARSITDLLPPPTTREILEVTKLHSLAGLQTKSIITTRPFRDPHHSASHVAIVGGGNKPKPGEISLAHRGVLYLDELPEFNRQSLEALRQPLEERRVTIARTEQTVTYPADVMLLASYNPCPCGFYGSEQSACNCTALAIQNYLKKLSGPLLDRIDLFVHVPAIDTATLLKHQPQAITATIKRVTRARTQQQQRFGSATKTNAHMTQADITSLGHLSAPANALLDKASARLKLSARAYLRTIRVSRTIADLEDRPDIDVAHVQEALQYRQRHESAFDP